MMKSREEHHLIMADSGSRLKRKEERAEIEKKEQQNREKRRTKSGIRGRR